MLQIKLFTVNPIQENTYVVSDETKEAVIIDCGCFTEREWKTVKDYIEDQHLRPVHLLNTHLHFDHCLGNRFAVRANFTRSRDVLQFVRFDETEKKRRRLVRFAVVVPNVRLTKRLI